MLKRIYAIGRGATVSILIIIAAAHFLAYGAYLYTARITLPAIDQGLAWVAEKRQVAILPSAEAKALAGYSDADRQMIADLFGKVGGGHE